MADVLKLLEERQGGKSDEQFANEMGIRSATLWRYKNGKSDINTAVRQRLIGYFAERDDVEMVGALLVYKTGRNPSKEQLSKIGSKLLSFPIKNDQVLVSAT